MSRQYINCIVLSWQIINPSYITKKKKVSRSLSYIFTYILNFKREKSKLHFCICFCTYILDLYRSVIDIYHTYTDEKHQ